MNTSSVVVSVIERLFTCGRVLYGRFLCTSHGLITTVISNYKKGLLITTVRSTYKKGSSLEYMH